MPCAQLVLTGYSDGAIIIKSSERDFLDLSPKDLKRLVQGKIWQDEHFDGALIKDIAKRESYSDRYVRNRIMASFKY